MKRYKGPELLRYEGLLGHTAVVTCKDKDGRERVFANTYPDRAAATFDELGEKAVGIYYRTSTPRTWGWKEVPRRVAVLDAA